MQRNIREVMRQHRPGRWIDFTQERCLVSGTLQTQLNATNPGK